MLSNVPRLLLLLLFWLFSFFLFSLLLLFAMFITICNNKTTPRDVSQIREREILKTYFYLSKLWKYHLQMFPHFSYKRTCLYQYRSWRYLLATRKPRVQPWFYQKMRWRIGNSKWKHLEEEYWVIWVCWFSEATVYSSQVHVQYRQCALMSHHQAI